MAELPGYRAASAIGVPPPECISSDIAKHDGESDVAWPPGRWAARGPSAAVLAARGAAKAHGRTLAAGQMLQAFVKDFYERIYITPAQLPLGNIASAQVSVVRIWNAYLRPQQLSHVSGLDEGIGLDAPQAIPFVWPALLEEPWRITVTQDGPARLDSLLRWVFVSVPAAGLRVTGTRIVPWVFVPDWSQPVTEQLAWLTDILANSRGAEQRRSLRIAPRKTYSGRFIAHGPERALCDLALASWGRKVWSLPVWPDVQLLDAPVAPGTRRIVCRTAHFDFQVGSLALLRGDSAFDCEAVEIAAIDAYGLDLKRDVQQAWPAYTRLYPLRTARLKAMPEILRRTAELLTLEAEFDLCEPAPWPEQLPATLYRGRPVFSARPDEVKDLSHGYERLTLELDNLTALPAVTDTAGRGFVLRQHRWALLGRAQQAAWRAFVYGLRGRAAAVWVPTHSPDLELAETASGNVLSVRKTGYSRFGLGTHGKQDVCFELLDGSTIYRRITAAAEAGALETLTLDTALPDTLSPSNVARISFMALCRMSSDQIELEHITDADGHATATVTWRGVRDDLETN